MLKVIGLIILAAIMIGVSCYDWGRVSEPGVLTQETCSDRNVPGCKNPEDFRDDSIAVVDPATGDTVRFEQTSRRMFLGRPNGLGWVFAVAALLPLYVAVRVGQREFAKRKKIVGPSSPLAGTRAWECPRCQSSNPQTSGTCWKCGWVQGTDVRGGAE